MNTPALLLARMHARLWVPAEPLSSPRFFISGLSESRRLLLDFCFFGSSRVRVQCCRVPCCRWGDRTFQIIFQPNNNLGGSYHTRSRLARMHSLALPLVILSLMPLMPRARMHVVAVVVVVSCWSRAVSHCSNNVGWAR